MVRSQQPGDVHQTSRADLLPRLQPQLIVGLLIMVTITGIAFAAPFTAPHSPLAVELGGRLLPPGSSAGGKYYALGSDALGRDVLSRILYGSRVSLLVSASAVFVAGVLGVALGMVAGYYRGPLERLIVRLADVQLAFPFTLLAIVAIMAVGSSLGAVIGVLVLSSWVVYTRTVRSMVIALCSQEFVEAARAIGSPDARIISRHLLPHVLPLAIVIASAEAGKMILLEAALGFLGLGIRPPTPSWGNMVGEGRLYLSTAWWISTFPGLAIVIAVIGISLLADGLRDAIDPHRRGGR